MVKHVVSVKLFGYPEIKYNNQVLLFSFSKVNALLYYLLVNKKSTRDEVASLLWPEKSEQSSKKNLRNAIYQVNKAVQGELIFAQNNKTLEINPAYKIESDLDQFLSEKDNYLDAYTEEFLKGFYIKDAEEFDLWILSTRQFFQKKFLTDFWHKIKQNIDQEYYDTVEKDINRLIEIDVYDEQNYQLLMQYYQKTHRDSKVIESYYRLANLLDRELGILPSKETRLLYENTLQKINTQKGQDKKQKPLLVIRQKVLSEIESALTTFFNQKKHKALLIEGKIGVGKSALIRLALQHSVSEHLQMITNCWREEKPFPYRAMRPFLKQIKDYAISYGIEIPKIWDDLLVTQADKLNEFSYIKIDVIERSIVAVLEALQQKLPIVIFFDDLHWMDDDSLDLLTRLIFQLKNHKVLFLLSVQFFDDLTLRNMINQLKFNDMIDVITINAFTKNETTKFLKQQLNKINDTIINDLYEKTLGVPFYLEEYTNALNKEQHIDKMTPRMQEFLREQFRHLNEDQLEIAIVLSYFKQQIPIDIISDITGYDESLIHETVDLLCRQGFLNEQNEQHIYVTFSHPKFKEYLYGKQTYTKKRLIHKKIALALEERYQLKREVYVIKEIAEHFEAAKMPLNALYYEIDNLQKEFQISYEFFPLNYINSKHNRVTEEQLLNVENIFNQMFEKIIGLEEEYHQNTYYQIITVKFYLLRGCYFIRNGKYNKGIIDIQKVIYYSSQQKRNEYLAQAYKQLIYYAIQIDDDNMMKKYVDESLDIVMELNNFEEMGVLLRLKGLYHLMVGEFDDAKNKFDESIQLFNITTKMTNKYSSNIAAANDYIAEIYRLQNQFEKALHHHEKALSLTLATPLISSQIIFYINKGMTHFYQKEYQLAKQVFESAMLLLPYSSPIWKQLQLEGYYALSLAMLGDVTTLVTFIETHMQHLEDITNPRDIGLIQLCSIYCYQLKKESLPMQLNITDCQKRALETLNPYRDAHELQFIEALLSDNFK